MTWTSSGSATGTWSASTASSLCWQQLSVVTDAQSDVDFMPAYVNDQYPLRVDDARPCFVIDTPTVKP